MSERTLPRAAVAGAVAGGVATGAAAGWLGAGVLLAKKVVTPERRRPDNTRLLALTADTVTLDRTPDTVVPGRYGLFQGGGATHLRFGQVLDDDPDAGTITRVLDGVDFGHPRVGTGRFHSYYYATNPAAALGLAYRSVVVESLVGDLPTWLVPAHAGDGADVRGRGGAGLGDACGDRWAVLVHGRGAGREETLRAMPTLRAAGYTCLAPSYRNDPDAPSSPDGLYGLGLSEWRDIEAAICFALDHGAREIALVGWSMGGAIVLQTLVNSPHRDAISRVVLDGPVVDWGDVLFHHAREMRVPLPLTAMSLRMLGHATSTRLVGVEEAIDVAHTNFVARADELVTPMLVVHSRDDEFVPIAPSRALAAARPDLVELAEWTQARHCKEWNVDPDRWEDVVGRYLA